MIGWFLCKFWSHNWTVISIGQKPCADVIDHWTVLVCRRCRRTSESHHFTEASC